MDGMGSIYVLMTVFAIGLITWALFNSRKRRRAMEAWCAQRGWTYVGVDNSMHKRFSGGIFTTGSSRRSSEVAVGTFQGHTCATYRYSYEVRSGEDSTTYTFHCVSARLPHPMPYVQLRREGFGSKLATRFGVQDIVFEWNVFNDAWRVQAASKELAFDVVHQQFMELMMRPEYDKVGLRFEGADVVMWTSGTPRIEEIDNRLRMLMPIVESIRPYVWDRLKGR